MLGVAGGPGRGGILSFAAAGGVAAGRGQGGAAGQTNKQEELEHQFVILGTVFIDPGFAYPGAQVRVRRAAERKVRWETRSDRRGEFAVRVPGGAEYEVAVSARCCAEVVRKVDARNGDRADLVFKLQPGPGAKKGKK